MGILESIYRAVTVPTFNEERLYEQVYEELSDNQIRIGLWTKALSESYGDEAAAKSIYIKLRVESIKEELIAWEKEQYRETKRLEKEQKNAEETRRIAEYKATHSNIKCKFCGQYQDVRNTEINYKKCDYCHNLISKAKHEYLFVNCRNCKTEIKYDKTNNIDKLINSECNNCNKILYKKGIVFKNALDIIYYCKNCNSKNSFKHDADLNTIKCTKCNVKLYVFSNNNLAVTSNLPKVIVDKDIKNRFLIEKDIITDKSTGLCWTKNINVAGSTVNREYANLNLTRYNGNRIHGIATWRIPNIDDFKPFKALAIELGYANDGRGLLKAIGFINVDLPYYNWTGSAAVSLKSFDKMPGSEFNHLWLVSG